MATHSVNIGRNNPLRSKTIVFPIASKPAKQRRVNLEKRRSSSRCPEEFPGLKLTKIGGNA